MICQKQILERLLISARLSVSKLAPRSLTVYLFAKFNRTYRSFCAIYKQKQLIRVLKITLLTLRGATT